VKKPCTLIGDEPKMYRKNNQFPRQMSLDDFYFPYGDLDPENRWIKLFEQIPWHEIEEIYSNLFKNDGAPALDVKIALGSLIIQTKMGCTDRELVEIITENPYLQFVLGAKEYSLKPLFGATTLVDFRKRLGEKGVELLQDVNELIIPKHKKTRKLVINP
jgi:hypothetical protein